MYLLLSGRESRHLADEGGCREGVPGRGNRINGPGRWKHGLWFGVAAPWEHVVKGSQRPEVAGCVHSGGWAWSSG